jgi:hypothetical protein
LGDKSAIRYRYQPASQITPDLDTLAEKVFDANQAYNRPKSGAVKQKRVTPSRDINQNGKATRLKGNMLPNIGDSRYVLVADEGAIEIIEVKVVGITRDPADGRYMFDVVYRLPEDDELKIMRSCRCVTFSSALKTCTRIWHRRWYVSAVSCFQL